jgi:DMSO/TMAO reductase YedYZ molybdopterin-dependent catalytic subunit
MNPTFSNRNNKVSRRGFLVAITGSALAAAAGCRPESAPAPTPYTPGSAATEAVKSSGATTTPKNLIDANYGKITYDKMIVTKIEDLYITQYDYNQTPAVDADKWTLKVDGLVENPVTLDYKAIKAFPAFEDLRTLECIGNPLGGNLIGNIMWKGFAFDEILKQIKVKPTATHIKFECADGYATSVELKWVTQPGVMMAYGMNGQPLDTRHGFPVRILTPGLYGQKMPRWITHLEFIDHYFKGYWESGGWSDVASVQTNSIIQSPPDSYSAPSGTQLAIQGVAWAGKRKITKVEVQIEGADWTPATLTQGDSPLAWTQWYMQWTVPAPGTYRVAVRATDDAGFVQNQEASGLFGDSSLEGVSAIHRITLQGT